MARSSTKTNNSNNTGANVGFETQLWAAADTLALELIAGKLGVEDTACTILGTA